MIQLVAFLGNYGKEYERTRHNVAWMFEDSLPFSQKFNWQDKYKADFCSVDYPVFIEWLKEKELVKCREDGSAVLPKNVPQKLYFMKPMTYMNLSGEAVGEAARFFKIPPEDVLIVHDEIELPFGTVSLKWSGGLGGHNGLRSLKAAFGTADFWRLRFGVGKPSTGDVASYVLGKFTPDEQISLAQEFEMTHKLFANVLTSADASKFIPEWGKIKLIQ